MNNLSKTLALLLCAAVVLTTLGAIAFGPNANASLSKTDFCSGEGQCLIDAPRSTMVSEVGQVPTLAPPRPKLAENMSSHTSNGRPVFVRVESNQAEIEVGWAPADIR